MILGNFVRGIENWNREGFFIKLVIIGGYWSLLLFLGIFWELVENKYFKELGYSLVEVYF